MNLSGINLFEEQKLYHCTISIDSSTADTLEIVYNSLPANQPKTFKNFVAVWEATMIPWNEEPLKKIYIENDSERGSLSINGLIITNNGYIVGYGVGPDITTICCSAVLKPIESLQIVFPTNVSIEIIELTMNMLKIKYNTLPGYLPKKYGNWIGVWKGFASPYNEPDDPIASTQINSNSTEGNVILNNINLESDSNYSIIYFMGKEITTAGSILYFKNNAI
jgi:hypothetical protein